MRRGRADPEVQVTEVTTAREGLDPQGTAHPELPNSPAVVPRGRPKRRRVTKSPEDRVDDLLEAAGRAFAEKGFEATTIGDITEAAQVAKGTFYLYFESKEHLLAAFWARYVDGFLVETSAVLERDEDWWPRMERLIRVLIGHAVRNADLHRLVYTSGATKAIELCRESNRRVVDTIGEFVARGSRVGAFQARDTDLAHRILYFGIDGLLDDLIARRQTIDTEAVVASAVEMARRALGRPAGS